MVEVAVGSCSGPGVGLSGFVVTHPMKNKRIKVIKNNIKIIFLLNNNFVFLAFHDIFYEDK